MKLYESDVMKKVWEDHEHWIVEVFGCFVIGLLLGVWLAILTAAVINEWWWRIAGVIFIPPVGIIALALIDEARTKLENNARDAMGVPRENR